MSGMNFLEKLLDGVTVEWKTLGDVCLSISAGGDLPVKYLKGQNEPTEEFPYPIYSNGIDEKSIYGYTDGYKVNAEAVTISARGTIGWHTVRQAKFTPIVRLIVLIPNTSSVTVKFLNYVLDVTEIGHSGGSIPQLTVPNVKKILIPIPPLEIQAEIVRILDTFTALTAELTAELTDRKKQYNYYRDRLLTFEEGEVEWKPLGDIAEINTGQKPTEIFDNATDYDYINAGTTRSGYSASSNCEGDTVTTPSRGQGGIGYVGYQKTPFWLGPLCYKLRSTDKALLINKYLFYFLQSESDLLLGLKKEGGVPAVNKSDLAKLEISVPPLEEQKRIVAILDKFDTLTHSISEGLPREIALRQKQYEYYRDLLLTFPKPEEVEV